MEDKQKGFTLIELLLVLGIIAVLAIAAFVIYPNVRSSSMANTEAININTIKAQTKSLYAQNDLYGTGGQDITQTLALSDVFPKDMLKVVGGVFTVYDSFQTTVDVTVSNGDVAANILPGHGFDITYNGIPSRECVDLIETMSQFNDVQSPAGTTLFTNGKLDPLKVIAACNATASPVFVFVSN